MIRKDFFKHLHCGASTQSCYFVGYFWHVQPAIVLILQLLCSPIGHRNFQKKRKENNATDWTPNLVLLPVYLDF